VLTTLLAACDADSVPPPDETITLTVDSGDVALSVQLSEGALPPGTNASDITSTAIESVEDLDRSTIAAFEFGPDGLRFERPIDVIVTLPPVEDCTSITATLISSNGTIEGLDLSVEPQQNQDDLPAVRL
jgi:hypothetical protein